MVKYKIGYDLDGVIANSRWIHLVASKLRLYKFKTLWKFLRIISLFATLKTRPLPGSVIITGRALGDKFITLIWLKLHKIQNEIYFSPCNIYSPEKAIKHKIETINRLGIDIFFEDDPEIARILEKECPNTRIVLW